MNRLKEISKSHQIEIETGNNRLDNHDKIQLKVLTKVTLHETLKVDEEKMNRVVD